LHQPSRLNRSIGTLGLIWFLFFAGSGFLVLNNPQSLRDFSKFTPADRWTDREILIGSWCYIGIGFAGAILFITRLILPMFARRPKIGDGATAPLFSFDVTPHFEHFHAFNALATARSAKIDAFIWLGGGAVMFIAIVHPQMRHDGKSFKTAVIAFGFVLLIRVVNKYLLRRILAGWRLWSLARWYLNWRHRAFRRVHFFDDGILVRSYEFRIVLPWYDVTYARRMDDAIGIVGRGQLVVIPTKGLTFSDVDQLMRLLDSKSILRAAEPSPYPAMLASAYR
jgi:hypothetical protein